MSADPSKTVGGQAVIEGVMMRAPSGWAVAARNPEGKIVVRSDELPRLSTRSFAARIPFVRGVLVLVESLSLGMKALTWSAKVAGVDGDEEELSNWAMFLSVLASLTLALGLFMVLPTVIAKWAADGNDVVLAVVETVVRLFLFVAYIWAIGRWNEIARVFQYHGAEHKTIHAFEAGDPLTVDEIQKYSPAHPRCGTSFLLLVIILSSIAFGALGDLPWLWIILSRIILVPVIAGIAYEILRFSGLQEGTTLARVIAAPGLWLQKLTTGEPDEQQVEVAVASLLQAVDELSREEILARGPVPEAALNVEFD